jgi:hypothetical protein
MRRVVINVMAGLFAAAVLGMTGCGSGGRGTTGTLTPTGTAVSLATMKSALLGTSPGVTFNFPNLVGSDSQGRAWSGSYQDIADGSLNFELLNVTRSRALLTLQLGSGTPVSGTNIKYFLAADRSYYKVIDDSGTVFVPTTQTALPDIPKVGGSGSIGTFTGSDGSTVTMTWALNADLNGASILAFTSVSKLGTATSTEVDSYHLNSAGTPTSITIVATVSGTTVTLAGARI